MFLLASLPFDFFYSHLIIISFAVHTLLHVKKERLKMLLHTRTLVLQSVFFVTLLGMLYSANKNEAGVELGRQLVIVLMPVLFCLTTLNLEKYRDRLLMVFALCCTLTVAFLYLDALRVIRFYRYPLNTLWSPLFTNHNFSDPIGMHATFFALQVGLALVYLLYTLIKPGKAVYKLFYAACCMLLFAGLIQLSSKSVLAALLIAVSIAIPFFMLSGKRRVMFISACLVIAGTSVWAISKSATFRERYFTDLEKDLSQAQKNESTDPRLARWETAVGLIAQSPVIGHGSGSEIALLKDAYFNKKLYSAYLNGLNAHDEYLSFLLKTGIVGLLIYLATLAYGFNNSIRSKDVIFFSFMLLVATVGISENLLDVDKGTLFYGFFFSFFAYAKGRPLNAITI